MNQDEDIVVARTVKDVTPIEIIREVFNLGWEVHSADLVLFELDKIEARNKKLDIFILRRAAEAFKSDVVDTGMWEMEAEGYGLTGLPMDEYREIWIEEWIEGDR